MSSIQLTHQLTANSALTRGLIAQGARSVERMMEGIVDDVEREVESIVAAEFDNGRSGFRSKGGTPLLGSIQADVTSPHGEFPVVVQVWSIADPAKVNSLESGARGHTIFAGSGDNLFFDSQGAGGGRSTREVFGRGAPGFNKPARTGRSKLLTKTPGVYHPGSRPYQFMRRGLDRAIRNRLRSAR